MRSLLYIGLALFIFTSCEEPFSLDLEESAPKVVIEGLVTNQPGYQRVKVSWSTSFYNTGGSPRITNAQVNVADNTGEVINFVHNPRNHKDSVGFYFPSTRFVGVLGRTYTLSVTVNNQLYQGSDRLVSVISMDSLKYEINEDQQRDPQKTGKYYELLMYAKEPQNERNFYLFQFYRNDSLTFLNDTDIYYSDDELLGENISGFPSPVYFGKGDKARVEVFSLTREGYVFYNDLWSILNNDGGGMFGPIPSSPRTNLSNGALGFFQVSAVTNTSVVIE